MKKIGTLGGIGWPSAFAYPSGIRQCGRMVRRLLAWVALANPLAAAAAAQTGLQQDVVFNGYTILAGNAERMHRLLSPLNAWRMQQRLLEAHQRLGEQAVDLSSAHFAIYVPTRQPPRGYALLVFVPPWEDARVPRQWIPALNRRGVIYVSAARSGNDADVLNRREPLALLAAWNVMQRYPVDAARIYVGGFSGGSRVALRLALAYPDLFRSALLEAGSDPIGSTEVPLPPTDLMHRFQQDSRLVFLTGEEDSFHLAQDARSRDSLKTWCVFDIAVQLIPHGGHEIAEDADFSRALNALDHHASPDAGKLGACRARNQQAMSAQLQQVESLIAQGKPEDARAWLERVDAQFGGLAAPRSVELMQKLDARH